MGNHEVLLSEAMTAIRNLRAEGARVHSLTNTVAQNFTANVLLACGATPSMTDSPQEADQFTARADALLINLGTLSEDRMIASRASIAQACESGIPVVLDPVMCQVSPPRLDFALELLAMQPAIMRANEPEVRAIREASTAPYQGVHVETGAVDRIHAGSKLLTIENGHEWLSKVTAVGCAQGSLIAALATKTEPLTAALAALLWTAIAGEIAATKSAGPGSFQANFIDSLHTVTTPEIEKRARFASALVA